MIKFDFFASPQEVVAYFQNKNPALHFDYDEILHSAHHKTFTVAKVTKLDLLTDIQLSLIEAQKRGLGFKEWKKLLTPTLAKKGWLGDIEVTNPLTGEVKEIYVGSRRLKTIYNTNMRVATSQAAYALGANSKATHIRYTAILDKSTRPNHSKLHGLILPINDPFWEKNYPPNAWNCRCKPMFLDENDIKQHDWKVGKSPLEDIAHPDWAYHVGKKENIDTILKDKVAALPQKSISNSFYELARDELETLDHKRNLYIWRGHLNHAIDELLVKKNKASPISAFQLGMISPFVSKEVNKHLNLSLKEQHIMGDKHGVLHVSPERKQNYGQALRLKELQEIVNVLDAEDKVSIDTKKQNIIYWFKDKEDEKKINKVVVDLNYKLKKFGVTNYMVTVGKVDKTNVEEKQYIKIRWR